MTEKPIDVRVAKAIGRIVELHTGDYPGWYAQSTRPGWESSAVETYWDKIPSYSTDPAAAWQALEAWTKGGDRSAAIGIARSGYHWCKLMKETPKLFHGQADTMPAAVCQAILAAEGK